MDHALILTVASMSDNDKKKYERNNVDRLISNFNSLKYSIIEPIRLRIERSKVFNKIHETNSPLISVCIPTFNRAKILMERAVDSVFSQSYQNFELIIIGDNCTDDTTKLLSKIKDRRLIFENFKERKRNYSETLENHWFVGGAVPSNRALEIATGDWIARIDDDDIWTKFHLEKLLNFAQKNNFEFVSALYEEERFGERKIVQGVHALDSYYTQRKYSNIDESPKIGGVSTWLYRSYLKFMRYNIDCWRKKWNRVWDIDLSLRFYKAGVRMGFLEEVLSYILPRPGEKSVGLEAYKLSSKKMLDKYKL